MYSVLQIIVLCIVIIFVLDCIYTYLTREFYEDAPHSQPNSSTQSETDLTNNSVKSGGSDGSNGSNGSDDNNNSNGYPPYPELPTSTSPIQLSTATTTQPENQNMYSPTIINSDAQKNCNKYQFNEHSVFYSTMSINGQPTSVSSTSSDLKTQTVPYLPLISAMPKNTGHNMIFGSNTKDQSSKGTSLLGACNQSIAVQNTRMNTVQTDINANNAQINKMNTDVNHIEGQQKILDTHTNNVLNEIKTQKNNAKDTYHSLCNTANENTNHMCNQLKNYEHS